MQPTWILTILFATAQVPVVTSESAIPPDMERVSEDLVAARARKKPKRRRDPAKKRRKRRSRKALPHAAEPQAAMEPVETVVELTPTTDELTKIAVLELGVDGDADPGLAHQFANRLAEVLGQRGTLEVVTPEDVRNLLELEELKQLLGCDDQSCLVELAGALGVDGVVRGRLARLANGYGVTLTATNTRTARNISRVNESWGGDPVGLFELAEPMVDELLATGDRELVGELTVEGTRQGSRVVVDGQLRGSHPNVTFDLPVGGHSLEILTDGHEPVVRWVVVHRDRPVRVAVQLKEESDPFYTTWWFWTATAVGVGLAAGGAYYYSTRGGADTGVNVGINANAVLTGAR